MGQTRMCVMCGGETTEADELLICPDCKLRSLPKAQKSNGRAVTTLQAILSVVMTPIMLLNRMGGVVSGIWLAVLGEWGVLILGVVANFSAVSLLGIALMPGLIFTPLIVLGERFKPFAFVGGFLSLTYTTCVSALWCVGVFYFFLTKVHATAVWPASIWAYIVATAPWLYMASQEQDNPSSFLLAFIIQIASLVLLFVLPLLKPDFGVVLLVTAGTFTLFSLVYSLIVSASLPGESTL